MKFKTEELEMQFASHALQERLKTMLNGLDAYILQEKIPELVVTSLVRPQDLKSDHRDGHAGDIRANNLTAPELAKILNWVHGHYWRSAENIGGWPMRSAYAHGKEESFHIHLSVDRLN